MSIRYFYAFILIYAVCLPAKTIVLDPLGDAHHTGRAVGHTFERSLTYKCAQGVSDALKGKHTVIITRSPGETRSQPERAELINRLAPIVSCSLSFYKGRSKQISIFTYKNYHSFMPSNTLFVRQDRAHLVSQDASEKYAATVKHYFEQAGYAVELLPIPYKPLFGIKSPALGIECSIEDESELKDITNYVSNVCMTLIENT